ncbi:MAG: GntR family transcriptional regulator, transcriptional repressor for pyruvate dehydrogenase complex [Trebonia sp.]|nr:GntR family transcriptional regulator, transcriptional repressor for pyruvate dehydrogenase complex [Trebonia sp.]
MVEDEDYQLRYEVAAGVDVAKSIVAVLTTTMTKASFVDPRNELLPHNIAVHADLITAIRDQDTMRLQKLLNLHHQDTVRVT